jgi:hypothetical protein
LLNTIDDADRFLRTSTAALNNHRENRQQGCE